MTGRSLHDALLHVLTDGGLRQRLLRGDRLVAGVLGVDEAAVLARSDRERLERMARFMGRHFYRERIVRLFRYGRALARQAGRDPLDVLDSTAFRDLLDSVVLGSEASADAVARLVEAELLEALSVPFGRDLLRYEGALFRVEAGPRQWSGGERGRNGVPVRSARARILDLEWDVTALFPALRRGDPAPALPVGQPTRLLVALSPQGRVNSVRCPEPVLRFLEALDGRRDAAQAAGAAGLRESDSARLLDQLTDLGAVEWRAIQ